MPTPCSIGKVSVNAEFPLQVCWGDALFKASKQVPFRHLATFLVGLNPWAAILVTWNNFAPSQSRGGFYPDHKRTVPSPLNHQPLGIANSRYQKDQFLPPPLMLSAFLGGAETGNIAQMSPAQARGHIGCFRQQVVSLRLRQPYVFSHMKHRNFRKSRTISSIGELTKPSQTERWSFHAFLLRTEMYRRRNQGALFWDHIFRWIIGPRCWD